MYGSTTGCFFPCVPELKSNLESTNSCKEMFSKLSLQKEKSSTCPYKLFHVDLTKTKSAHDQWKQKFYDQDFKKYGEHHSYSIHFDENKKVKLIPNHRPRPTRLANGKFVESDPLPLIDPQGTYDFVIVPYQKTLQLRLSTGSHYLIAEKADDVYAAGNIIFKNNEILCITDLSGAYCNIDAKDPEFYEYRKSFKRALAFFDLPLEKFAPVIAKNENADDSILRMVPS